MIQQLVPTDTALALPGANTAPRFAQWGYSPKVDYATGSSPKSVIRLDANGDGKVDIAVANDGSDTVSVFLGNGDGTFAPKVDYVTGRGPYSVASLDANGDGKMDLAVANSSSSTVSVLLGKGDGTFAPKVDYATGSVPWSVTSLDANGDGTMDLAVANVGSDTVSILLGNGNGTFAPKVDYVTGNFPHAVTSLDANGDGKMDLAVANFLSNSVSVLLNNGNGTFAPKVDYVTGNLLWSVVSLDANGDGKMDMAVTNSDYNSSSTVSVLLGNGNGTFASKVDYATGNSPGTVTSLDANGDGKMDLAVANYYSNLVLPGNGDGTFASKVDTATGSGSWSVTSLDANGDGNVDLAVANLSAGTVSILINTRGSSSNRVVYTESSSSVYSSYPNYSYAVLNYGIEILDTELAAAGNYGGATLTLARHGAASGQDRFDAVTGGTLSTLTSGSYFSVDGVTIGKVANNAAGTLRLAFNDNATQALVNRSLSQIGYANTSDTPPASVQIDWAFSDGNTGAQGSGGALEALVLYTSVAIAPANDSPVVVQMPGTRHVPYGIAMNYSLAAGTFADPDLDALTYSVAMANGTGIPPWLKFNAATQTFTGTPSAADLGSITLLISAKDSANLSASVNLTLTVDAPDAPKTLTGKASHDTLAGGTGNDTFDGGAGVDTVVFASNKSAYALTKTSTGYTVSGPEGSDTLTNIERLKFADQAVAIDVDAPNSAGGIYRLYGATFNRTPDLGGLGFWIAQSDKGRIAVDIATEFTYSAEFQTLYATKITDNYAVGADITALVTAFYTNVLHRAPDLEGRDWYANQIATHAKTVGQVLAEISDSQEYIAQLAGVIGNGITYTPWVG